MDLGKVNGAGRRLGFLGLLLATSAASQTADRDAAIRLLAAQDAAVAAVGERLSIAARDLCSPAGWATGLVIQTRSQFGLAYREAAGRLLAVGEYPTIVSVVPGSAATRAGLARGDEILAIDATPLPRIAPSNDTPRIADSERALDAMEASLGDGEVELRIKRRGAASTIRLRATPACRARFEVRAGSETNASADRHRVQVSSDLVDPARTDQDLAPLIAHELSHVILRHEDALRQSRRGMLPGFGKGGAALRASEIAADRLSVYLLARAGYRAADAIPFWTALGQRTDQGIFSDRTHPDWKTRVAAIRIEVARVAAQQAAGQAIIPPPDLMVIPSR